MAIAVVGLLWIAVASYSVIHTARGRTYSDLDAIPARRVGLVLGCSRLLPNGWRNAFFDNRMEAAAALFRAHKVDYLVVSGDNHSTGYDEPRDMKDRLVSMRLPEDRIYCDYAGFRTLDSIVRMHEIFGQTEVTRHRVQCSRGGRVQQLQDEVPRNGGARQHAARSFRAAPAAEISRAEDYHSCRVLKVRDIMSRRSYPFIENKRLDSKSSRRDVPGSSSRLRSLPHVPLSPLRDTVAKRDRPVPCCFSRFELHGHRKRDDRLRPSGDIDGSPFGRNFPPDVAQAPCRRGRVALAWTS